MSEDDDRLHREQITFLERHKNADFLIVDSRLGHCTEATYYSPMKKEADAKNAYAKEFFKKIFEAGGFTS